MKLEIERVQHPLLPKRARKAPQPQSAVPMTRDLQRDGQAGNGLAKAQRRKRAGRKNRERNWDPATTVLPSDKEWRNKARRPRQPRRQPATMDIASRPARKIGQVPSRVVRSDPLGNQGMNRGYAKLMVGANRSSTQRNRSCTMVRRTGRTESSSGTISRKTENLPLVRTQKMRVLAPRTISNVTN